MKNYSFNVFWSDSDKVYIAVCPEFPNLSAFGDTAEQALAEIKIALELAVETYQEEGWPLPEPKGQNEYSGQLRVRLPKSLHAKLAAQANEDSISLNSLIISYLSEAVGEVSGQEKQRDVLSVSLQELGDVATELAKSFASIHSWIDATQQLQRFSRYSQMQQEERLAKHVERIAYLLQQGAQGNLDRSPSKYKEWSSGGPQAHLDIDIVNSWASAQASVLEERIGHGEGRVNVRQGEI